MSVLVCSWTFASACYDAQHAEPMLNGAAGARAVELDTRDGLHGESLRRSYAPCQNSKPQSCGRDDEAYCASYTSNPEHSFCAPLCEEDGDCPTISGYSAACNFAFCAILCDDGVCPTGMTCEHDATFIDRDGNDRGPESVCISAESQRH